LLGDEKYERAVETGGGKAVNNHGPVVDLVLLDPYLKKEVVGMADLKVRPCSMILSMT